MREILTGIAERQPHGEHALKAEKEIARLDAKRARIVEMRPMARFRARNALGAWPPSIRNFRRRTRPRLRFRLALPRST
jgi:hypothetical protein